MRRTVRGSAATLGALAIVAGTAACGSLMGSGGEESGGGTSVEEEQPEEGGDSESGAEGEGAAETGESEQDASDEGTTDETTEDDDASAESEDAAADEGEDSASGPLSEDDLSAAGDRYFEFFQVAASGDAEATCAFLLDPTTGEAMSGEMAAGCAKGFEGQMGEGFDSSVLDALDRSMIEAVDKGDGTAEITMMGTSPGHSMVKASDGQWYLDLGTFG